MKTNINVCIDTELVFSMKEQGLNISGTLNQLLSSFLQSPEVVSSRAKAAIKQNEAVLSSVASAQEEKDKEKAKAEHEKELKETEEWVRTNNVRMQKRQDRYDKVRAHASFIAYKNNLETEKNLIKILFNEGIFINSQELQELQ